MSGNQSERLRKLGEKARVELEANESKRCWPITPALQQRALAMMRLLRALGSRQTSAANAADNLFAIAGAKAAPIKLLSDALERRWAEPIPASDDWQMVFDLVLFPRTDCNEAMLAWAAALIFCSNRFYDSAAKVKSDYGVLPENEQASEEQLLFSIIWSDLFRGVASLVNDDGRSMRSYGSNTIIDVTNEVTAHVAWQNEEEAVYNPTIGEFRCLMDDLERHGFDLRTLSMAYEIHCDYRVEMENDSYWSGEVAEHYERQVQAVVNHLPSVWSKQITVEAETGIRLGPWLGNTTCTLNKQGWQTFCAALTKYLPKDDFARCFAVN